VRACRDLASSYRASQVVCTRGTVALANQLRFVVDFVQPPVLKVQLDTVYLSHRTLQSLNDPLRSVLYISCLIDVWTVVYTLHISCFCKGQKMS
jgi:hypothetical protein